MAVLEMQKISYRGKMVEHKILVFVHCDIILPVQIAIHQYASFWEDTKAHVKILSITVKQNSRGYIHRGNDR